MYRKFFLIAFPLLVISGIIALILQWNDQYPKGSYSIAGVLWQACLLWLLSTAIIYGSMRKTAWVVLTEGILCVVMIAVVLFRLCTSIDLDLLVLICPPVVAIVYLIHFFMKKGKRWFIDIVKVIFVAFSLLAYQAILLGTRYEDEILGSWTMSFLLLAIVVYREVYRYCPPERDEGIASKGSDIFVHKNQ